jgi:hypothetical protein
MYYIIMKYQGENRMKNILKLAGLLAIAIMVITCTPKQSGTATQPQTSSESGTVTQPQTSSETSAGEYDPNTAGDFKFYIGDASGMVTITAYTGSNRNIIIPSQIQGAPVIAIGEEAFREKELTSVTIPNTVTSIGDFAFYMNKITSVTIPNNVEEIGEAAFANNQLTSVTIPNRITEISASTFRGNQLTSVVIPNSVTLIHRLAFSGNQLTSVTIPNGVTEIGSSAFAENKLTSITIPKSVTKIGDRVFAENQLNGNVTIPDASAVEIGDFAFQADGWYSTKYDEPQM